MKNQTKQEDGGYFLVTEKLGELTLSQQQVVFPQMTAPEPALISAQYERFLSGVQQRCQAAKVTLPELKLVCFDLEAIHGLMDYLQNHFTLPFDTLVLSMPVNLSSDQQDVWLTALKRLLPELSKFNTITLKLERSFFNEAIISLLVHYISAQKDISSSIDLPPEWASSPYQQRLDEIMSERLAQKVVEPLAVETKKTIAPTNLLVKRTRVRHNHTKKMLNVEEEREEERQQEAAVEIVTAHKQIKTDEPDVKRDSFINNANFRHALVERRGWRAYQINPIDSKAYEFNSSSDQITKMLQKLFGSSLKKIWFSEQAISALSSHFKPTFTAQHDFNEPLPQSWNEFDFAKPSTGFHAEFDLEHPPAGFQVKYVEPQINIDYDEQFKQEKDPFAIEFLDPQPIFNLPHHLFMKGLSALEPDHLIVVAWKRLNEQPYDRHAHQTFKNYLPRLMTLPPQALMSLMVLSFHTGTFNPIAYQWNLEQAIKIHPRVLKLTGIEEDLNVGYWIKEQLFHQLYGDIYNKYNRPNEDVFKKINELTQQFVENHQPDNLAWPEHLLHQLIGDSDLIEALLKIEPTLDLNALISLAVPAGNPKLGKLLDLAKADEDFFHKLHATIYSKNKRYEDWIKPDTVNAINAIKGFLAPQRAWWNALFEQHTALHMDVDLASLVNTFKDFKKKVTEFELLNEVSLPWPDPTEMKPIRSLPTTLARILLCLERTSLEHVGEVWKRVLKLDWSNPLLNEYLHTPTRVAFLIPEMEPDVLMEDRPDKWKEITRGGSYKNPKLFSLEEVKIRFFTFISREEDRAQLPLAFYLAAQEKIGQSGLSEAVQSWLFALIASATTGVDAVASIESLAEATQSLEKMIDLLKKAPSFQVMGVGVTAEVVRLKTCEALSFVNKMPPLPHLVFILEAMLRDSNSTLNLRTNALAWGRLFGSLTEHALTYGSRLYVAAEDYLSKAKSKPNQTAAILTEYLEMIGIFDAIWCFDHAAQNFISLIPLFQLKRDDFGQVIKHQDCENGCFLHIVTTMPSGYFNPYGAYKGNYLFNKTDEKLYYVTQNGKAEAVNLDDLNYFKEELQRNNYRDECKIFLRYPIITKMITLNGGPIHPEFKPGKMTQALIDITKKIRSTASPANHEKRLYETISILRGISYKNTALKPLNGDDLISLLNTVIFSETPVREQLKTLPAPNGTGALMNYLPQDFFDNYAKRSLSSDLLQKIQKHFVTAQQEPIKQILIRFSHEADEAYYDQLLAHLISACNTLNQLEKNQFIAYLNSTSGLYDTTKRLDEKHPFMRLLDLIRQQGTITPFISIIKRAKVEGVKEDLAEKIGIYMGTLSASILHLPGRIIPQLDYTPKLIHTLLKTPPRELLRTNAWYKPPQQHSQYTVHHEETYTQLITSFYKTLNDMVSRCPSARKPLLALYDTYLASYNATEHGAFVPYLERFRSDLEQTLIPLNDPNLVLSLCLQFNTDNQLKPSDLFQLIDALKACTADVQGNLLRIVIKIIDDDRDYDLTIFKQFCALYEDPTLRAALDKFYQCSPYPGMQQVLAWHATSNLSMSEAYQAYRKNPCHRETENGFYAEKAKTQWEEIEKQWDDAANKQPDALRLRAGYFDDYEALTKKLQEKSIDELLAIFHTPDLDDETLFAVSAELLHHALGRDKTDAKGKFIHGSSMEINTTQHMAGLLNLKAGKIVTTQVETGEGKTRIMMILDACKLARNKTVDLVTSDMSLATRDYFASKSYYEMLGYPTTLVYANSKPEDYQKKGRNVSDIYNISAFRNAARCAGKLHLTRADELKDMHLSLDEGDKLFDMAQIKINESRASDERIRNMSRFYMLLMTYFHKNEVVVIDGLETTPLELFYNDIDLSRQYFLNYVYANMTNEEVRRIHELLPAQIEIWQESAITAMQQVFNKDYVIETDQWIKPPMGSPKYSSEVRLLSGNRIAKNSKLSEGVHQCLQALHELMRTDEIPCENQKLKARLQDCEAPFDIPDEKKIVISSTPYDLLSEYDSMMLLTGTVGRAHIEQAEASQLYDMSYLLLPRHEPRQREDFIKIFENQSKQIEALIDLIKASRERNQPVLILTENYNECADVTARLIEAFQHDQRLQEINSQATPIEESRGIALAGLPGWITISTDKLSRGVDIILQDEAAEYGLHTVLTYLPKSMRALNQSLGRSARGIQPGETTLILDQTRLPKSIQKAEADIKETKQAIVDYQDRMAIINQRERLIHWTLGQYKRQFTVAFYDTIFPQLSTAYHDEFQTIFADWIQKSNEKYKQVELQIQAVLNQKPPDLDKINEFFKLYQQTLQACWHELRARVEQSKATCKDVNHKPIDLLTISTLPTLQLSDKIKALFTPSVVVEVNLEEDDVADYQFQETEIPAEAATEPVAPITPKTWISTFLSWIGTVLTYFWSLISFAVNAIVNLFYKQEEPSPPTNPSVNDDEVPPHSYQQITQQHLPTETEQYHLASKADSGRTSSNLSSDQLKAPTIAIWQDKKLSSMPDRRVESSNDNDNTP